MKITAWILGMFICSYAFAQIDPPFTLFHHNTAFYNPTLTGNDIRTAAFQYRNQWPELPDNPRIITAFYSQQVKGSAHNLGGQFLNEHVGFTTTTTLSINYHFNLKLSEKSALRIGLRPYYFKQSLDISKLKFATPFDPVLMNYRPKRSWGIVPGISWVNNNAYAGLAVNVLQMPDFTSNNSTIVVNWHLNAGYNWQIGKRWQLKPSFLYLNQSQFELYMFNGTICYNKKAEVGFGYRGFATNTNPYNFNLGVHLFKSRLTLAYSYDMATTSPNIMAMTAHELVMKYRWLKAE